MAIGKIIVVALAIFCYIQVDAAFVKRDTSTTNDLESALSNLGSVLSQGWANFSHAVGLDNLPSHEEVANNLHEKTMNLARTLGNYVGQLQTEATSHQGDLHNVLEQVAAKWNETATSLQNTDANKTAQELQQQAHDSLNSFLEEARKISTAVGTSEGTESVRNVASQAISRVQELANEFKNSVQASTSH